MAFRHGRFAEITIAGTNLSAYCDSADLNVDVDTSDTTTFGKSWKTHVVGTAGATIEGGGNYDPTAGTGPVVVLTGLIGNSTPQLIQLWPGGSAAGQIKHQFSGSLVSYQESSPVGDKATFTFSILASGDMATVTV